jgi:adenylate kinase family enzyme
MNDMRIVLFGRPGSGKSTCALRLHQATGLPLYHLDAYFFLANWQERIYHEFLSLQQQIVDQDRWIIDGNSLQSLAMRYARADLVLYFNYPRWRCLWRIFKRRLGRKNLALKDKAEGCNENVSWQLLRYMWTFQSRLNGRLMRDLARLRGAYPHVRLIEISSDKQWRAVEQEIVFGRS